MSVQPSISTDPTSLALRFMSAQYVSPEGARDWRSGKDGALRALPIYVVHERGRAPWRAGRWLIADLRASRPVRALITRS